MSGSPTRWLLGCVTNLSLHWPEIVVVSELGAASVMSLPGGPWKSLACFARTPHVTMAGLHATSATTVTVSERPGWSARFRSRTVLPTTVAVAGPATDAERSDDAGGHGEIRRAQLLLPVRRVAERGGERRLCPRWDRPG